MRAPRRKSARSAPTISRRCFAPASSERIRGLGPATLAVIGDLVDTGESALPRAARGGDAPGLARDARRSRASRAAHSPDPRRARHRDGRRARSAPRPTDVWPRSRRSARRPRSGFSTASPWLRARGSLRLFQHALAEARHLLDAFEATRTSSAPSSRVRCVGVSRSSTAIDIVAECDARSGSRRAVVHAASRRARKRRRGRVGLDRVRRRRATHGALRVAGRLRRRAVARHRQRRARRRQFSHGSSNAARRRRRRDPRLPAGADEARSIAPRVCAYIEPELREGRGEVDAADARRAADAARRVRTSAARCTATRTTPTARRSVAEMVHGARDARLELPRHHRPFAGRVLRRRHDAREDSRAARGDRRAQRRARPDVRVLKGVEADILVDGRLDYDERYARRCSTSSSDRSTRSSRSATRP